MTGVVVKATTVYHLAIGLTLDETMMLIDTHLVHTLVKNKGQGSRRRSFAGLGGPPGPVDEWGLSEQHIL